MQRAAGGTESYGWRCGKERWSELRGQMRIHLTLKADFDHAFEQVREYPIMAGKRGSITKLWDKSATSASIFVAFFIAFMCLS